MDYNENNNKLTGSKEKHPKLIKKVSFRDQAPEETQSIADVYEVESYKSDNNKSQDYHQRDCLSCIMF